MSTRITKIVSGGQTGADRAALDVGQELGFSVGGFVPKGRADEDGPISDYYPNLIETDSADPAVRTEANALHADGTLVVSHGQPSGGTALTLRILKRSNKPYLHVDFTRTGLVEAARRASDWIDRNCIETLNVAGPRASEDAAVYCHTQDLLRQVLDPKGGNNNDTYCYTQAPLKQPCEPKVSNNNIAIAVYEQAMDKWRHWDTIRWLVPNWFYTITGAAATLAPHNISSLRIIAALLATVGLLSLYLMLRLDLYHRRTITQTGDSLRLLLQPGAELTALTTALPFSFVGLQRLRTATFYYEIVIGLVILGGIALAMNLFDLAKTAQGLLATAA